MVGCGAPATALFLLMLLNLLVRRLKLLLAAIKGELPGFLLGHLSVILASLVLLLQETTMDSVSTTMVSVTTNFTMSTRAPCRRYHGAGLRDRRTSLSSALGPF